MRISNTAGLLLIVTLASCAESTTDEEQTSLMKSSWQAGSYAYIEEFHLYDRGIGQWVAFARGRLDDEEWFDWRATDSDIRIVIGGSESRIGYELSGSEGARRIVFERAPLPNSEFDEFDEIVRNAQGERPRPQPRAANASPDRAAAPPPGDVPRLVSGPGYRGIVSNRGSFLLDDEAIALLESALSRAIAAHPDIDRAARAYTREYLAYVVGSEERVSIRLHCEVRPGWRNGLPVVRGGGDCYLHASYRVRDHRILELSPSSRR